jgi:PPP family 3-phenylpropionic acid transporter
VGWAYFISAASEVPFLLNSDRLFKKHGAGRLMCVSALFMTVRWLIVAVTGNPVVAMCSQLLHAMGFIVITVTVAKYVQATVPQDRKAEGQLLISVFGFGVARAIGYFGGGVLSDASSRQSVFYVCAAVCALCLVVFAPYYFRRAPMNGEDIHE